MKASDWFPIYYQILEDFGFSAEKDDEAAELMYKLGEKKFLDLTVLREKIRGRSVAVIGYALKSNELEGIGEEIKITAGKALIKARKIHPEFIPEVHVTDLEEDDLLIEIEKKSLLVLHAHGDNIPKIKSIVPRLSAFVATTQSKPFNKIYNFGGFTDGDRAALIAKDMGASEIKLYGFDFEKTEGAKKRKLEWARKILKLEGILE
jgi:hypothetical protein